MVNKPINKYKSGAIEAAIWSNEKTFNENKVEFKTVSLTRSYKKNDEEVWRSEFINNIRRNDLQKIEALLRKAQDYLYFENVEGAGKDD